MKVLTGIINKVLTEEQFEEVLNKNVERNSIDIEDTIRYLNNKNGDPIAYVQIKLSKKEVDRKGRDKQIYNEDKGEYEVCYTTSKIINAYNKEMRIIMELGEYSPVKIVVEEKLVDGSIYLNALCIQDQTLGILEK